MGADEEGRLQRLRAHRRELVDPKISEHRGRIVKTTGDGMLVEFPSVVDAVRCAVEIQRAMADRNACIAEDQRIIFRIGVNLGDSRSHRPRSEQPAGAGRNGADSPTAKNRLREGQIELERALALAGHTAYCTLCEPQGA
jgi:class 3 adenylate cyclase